MHPAPSIILFTTLSGLGFGLLIFLGAGMPVATGEGALGLFAIAYALAGGGLVASIFHLANPVNAIKAFSQWRSSWLSREGICAVATLLTMAPYGLALILSGSHIASLGYAGAALAAVTVFATAMIYAQIRAVPRWNQPATPLHLVLVSLAGGALLAGQGQIGAVLLAGAGGAQAWHWVKGDRRLAESGATMGAATALPGRVRQLEPPHTGTNYLMREMIFHVGRRHRRKLRRIAFGLGYIVPIGCVFLLPAGFGTAIGALIHTGGVLVSRWLFFAEAEHVVGLYYGQRGH